MTTAFSRLPFDHMIFTGATSVGKHIMRAAADNLVPVTLDYLALEGLVNFMEAVGKIQAGIGTVADPLGMS